MLVREQCCARAHALDSPAPSPVSTHKRSPYALLFFYRSYEGKDVVEEFRRRDRAKQDPRTQAPPKSRLGRFGFSFG